MDAQDRLIDGATAAPLAIRDYGGAGTPILLIPGGGRTVVDWDPIAADLVADHRVVAMDVRNHGRSGDGPWAWDEVLADVQLVIEATGLISPAIVGHSLGGMIAALYGASGRDCRCAVNVDGYGRGRVDQYPGYTPDEVRERWADQRGLDPERRYLGVPIDADRVREYRVKSDREGAMVGIPAEIIAGGFERSIRPLPDGKFVIRPGVDSFVDLVDALSVVDWFATFRDTRSPLLVYNCVDTTTEWADAEQDAVRFNAAYRAGLGRDLAALADEVSSVRVRTLDAGHMVILTMPDLIAADLRAFIGSVAAG